jgi:hypothetical protein
MGLPKTAAYGRRRLMTVNPQRRMFGKISRPRRSFSSILRWGLGQNHRPGGRGPRLRSSHFALPSRESNEADADSIRERFFRNEWGLPKTAAYGRRRLMTVNPQRRMFGKISRPRRSFSSILRWGLGQNHRPGGRSPA